MMTITKKNVEHREQTKSKQSFDNLLADFKQMRQLAVDINALYVQLDARHHELTYLTLNMEKRFAELFQSIHGCTLSNHEFKAVVEQVCREQDDVQRTRTQTFFIR